MTRKAREGLQENILIASDRNPLPLYDVAASVAKENYLPSPAKQRLAPNTAQNKRLSSDKIVKLGYRFVYPSYNSQREQNILFYDSTCGFCHGIVQFLLSRDRYWTFYYAPLYGELFQEKEVKTLKEESIILYQEGRETLYKSDAVIATLVLLGGKWEILGKGMKIFPQFLRDFVYDVVGKVRYRFAGKVDKETCALMPLKYQERILS